MLLNNWAISLRIFFTIKKKICKKDENVIGAFVGLLLNFALLLNDNNILQKKASENV